MKDKISRSSVKSFQEDYSWAKESKFSVEEKKDYLRFPLGEWKKIVFDKDSYLAEEEDYQADVAKILKQDLFKDYRFYKENKGKIDFEFNKVYEKPFKSIKKNLLLLIFSYIRFQPKNFLIY
jgi:hypothetical protein